MLGLKLNHVSKRGHWSNRFTIPPSAAGCYMITVDNAITPQSSTGFLWKVLKIESIKFSDWLSYISTVLFFNIRNIWKFTGNIHAFPSWYISFILYIFCQVKYLVLIWQQTNILYIISTCIIGPFKGILRPPFSCLQTIRTYRQSSIHSVLAEISRLCRLSESHLSVKSPTTASQSD